MSDATLEKPEILENSCVEEYDGILKKYVPPKNPRIVIGRIASSFYFVHQDEKIHDVAGILLEDERIFALGITDKEQNVLGIIIRNELFDTLGKPFGRDLYTNKTIDKQMTKAISFDYSSNLFVIAEEVRHYLNMPNIQYYLLTTDGTRFSGIFSTKDMLIYLSEMTQKDINLARNLQMSIVKEEHEEQTDKFEIIGSSIMAKGVGGDYYVVRNYNPGEWLITICDVSGKGIAASLITAIVGGMLSIFDFTEGIRQFIVKLNDYIITTFRQERFITGIFVNFNENTGELTLFDLGHSYLFVFRNDRLVKMNTKDDNIPLGIKHNIIPKGAKFTLQKGDILVLLTDGVVEQTDLNGGEYGIQRLSGTIKEHRREGLKQIKNALIEDIHSFRSNQPQHDDMTLVFLEYTG